MAACSSRTILLALLAAGVLGCGRPEPRTPRLVILYGACTVRRDFLEPYRADVPFTPALAALAREGLVFRDQVTETGQSGIAFASLITGTQADRHGIYHHPSPLPEDNVTLAECFAAAGWETWFWSGQPVASAPLGYGQGVAPEHVRDHEHPFRPTPTPFEPGALEGMSGNDADFAALIERVRTDPKAHVYVQLFFTASHEPYHQYVTPDEIVAFCRRYPQASRGVTAAEVARWLPVYEEHRHGLNWDFPATRAALGLSDAHLERLSAVLEVAYAACIAQLDELFGRFRKALTEAGLDDETLLCFTSDHGEVLYRPGALFPWTHGMGLEPEVLEVPWIVRAPGLAPGAFEGVSRSIDVLPTLLGLCDLPVPGTVEGVNLAPALRGQAPAPELTAFSHSSTLGERRLARFADMQVLQRVMPAPDPANLWTSLRTRDLFLRRVRFAGEPWRFQAYDPERDPDLAHDLFDPDDPAQQAHCRALEAYAQRLIDAFGRERATLGAEDELELLRAIGYVR